jgi:hypothetical protein
MLDTPHTDAVPAAAAPASAWSATRALVPLFSVTLFLSSFLMFTVEPMVARQMLPVLGGVPMVWNGCVVFFQAMLLAGYGGAHVLTRGLVAPARLLVYAAVAVLPLAFTRLGVDAASVQQATQAPLSWLLMALLTTVGPSFLVLAVSASTLQATFSASRHESARDPYFLYAASNAGSLAALIAYPTLVEPLLGLSRQANVWTIAYGVFVLFVLACAVVARFALSAASPGVVPAAAVAVAAEAPITWRQRARWCVLAALPSSLMLGVTTALTTDIAPVPMLWVAPLGLYLLTFIIAFGRGSERGVALANRFLPALLLGLSVSMMLKRTLPILPALLLHLIPFLAAAMLCHGRLAKERPSARHLTEFYLWLAFGGMVGGLFNTLVAPVLFSGILEYPLALTTVALLRPADPSRGGRQPVDWALPVAAAVVAAAMLFNSTSGAWTGAAGLAMVPCALLTLRRRHQPFTVAAVAGIFLLASPWVNKPGESVLHAERTFFGAYRVSADPRSGTRRLAHGTTLHGMQLASSPNEPLTYYHRTGPLGRTIAALPRLQRPGEIAAVGLGVGTLAAYARPGQQWTFFEIDPAIERIARDDRYFTYLKNCGNRCRVVLGDARLSLLARPEARYKLIVLDAFSSDAIPMHLMTQEAMALYLSRLEEHGVMAFHVSNRHLDLGPVVSRLAASKGLAAMPLLDRRVGSWPAHKTASSWVMVARTTDDLQAVAGRSWTPPPVKDGIPLWTDDFSNVFDVISLKLY